MKLYSSVSPQPRLLYLQWTLLGIEIVFFILVIVLYSMNKGGDWHIEAEGLFISYVVVKAVLILARILVFGFFMWFPKKGIFFVFALIALWLPTAMGYYIVLIINFYKKDSSWMEKNSLLFGVLVMLLIESLAGLALIFIFIAIAVIFIPLFTFSRWRREVKEEYKRKKSQIQWNKPITPREL